STGSDTGPSTASSASSMSAIIVPMVERRERVRAFMEEHVYPNEPALAHEDDAADALRRQLQQQAKVAGLWAPHLPPEAGGSGGGFLEYANLNEEIGRSFVAQLVFGCQAPDAGNGEILHLYGTEEQKERFLRPLVAGETRSFFGMTEPEVAGSDPTLLRGRADRAEAAGSRPDPPRDALARADAARVRADVLVLARAQGVRRPARRQADDSELDRRVGGRDRGLSADDSAGGAEARRGRRG